MKKNTLLLSCCFLLCSIFSANAQTKGHYTPYGGVLGGANYSSFRLGDNTGLSSEWRWGWAAGVYVGFPIGNVVSIEPQALYSIMGANAKNVALPLSPRTDNQLDYLSVPVLFKFHIGPAFNLFVGPQFDFLMKASRKTPSEDIKDQIKKNDIAATGGFELFPRSRITFYARYIYGFNKIPENQSPEKNVYNEGIQAGLKIRLFGKHVNATPPPPPPPPPPPTDSDGDGVNDVDDKCPNQAGVAKYQGCPIPDSDGDGVNDEMDKCPNQAGSAKYQGCPIPDTDGDGINDEQDKCPNQAGTAKYQGCPVPDSDSDGINDDDDKCPLIKGTAENGGCPSIEKFNSATVQFVTGSAVLTKNAKLALGYLVLYMRKFPDTKVAINGYTDNTGKAEKNLELSKKRAEAAKAFLVSKDINGDRITTDGFGVENPIADNKTPAGRTKNRRIEFKVSQ